MTKQGLLWRGFIGELYEEGQTKYSHRYEVASAKHKAQPQQRTSTTHTLITSYTNAVAFVYDM